MLLAVIVSSGGCGRLGFGLAGADAGDDALLGATVFDRVTTGAVRIQSGESSVVETVPGIDPARAFLVFGVRSSSSVPGDFMVTGELGPGTITFEREGASNEVVVRYYVVEFATGASIQRGGSPLPDSIQVSTSPFSSDRAFSIVTQRSTGMDFNDDDFPQVSLRPPTTLDIEIPYPHGATADVVWQLVELADAHVQQIAATLPTGMLSLAVPIEPIAPTAAWLNFSYGFYDDGGAVEAIADRMVLGAIESPTSLRFSRGEATATLQIVASIIELPRIRVQHGTAPMPAGLQDVLIAISPIDVNRAFATGPAAGHVGSTSFIVDDVGGVASFTYEPLDASTLAIRRGAALGDSTASWSVIEFEP